MKRKVMFVVALSIVLTAWSILTYASHVYATEVKSLKTVTLLIEGMT